MCLLVVPLSRRRRTYENLLHTQGRFKVCPRLSVCVFVRVSEPIETDSTYLDQNRNYGTVTQLKRTKKFTDSRCQIDPTPTRERCRSDCLISEFQIWPLMDLTISYMGWCVDSKFTWLWRDYKTRSPSAPLPCAAGPSKISDPHTLHSQAGRSICRCTRISVFFVRTYVHVFTAPADETWTVYDGIPKFFQNLKKHLF